MSLVQYPDSDTDNDDDGNAIPAQTASKLAVKRKRSEDHKDDLPPLPSAFHDLYATNARLSTSDDPSLHGGRKRAVPHIQGNWPSHIYLECKHDFLSWFSRKKVGELTCWRDTLTGRV